MAGRTTKRLAVAVSGGGDSLALLGLACDWAARNDCRIHALTVDHGLRPEAADEARLVTREAVRLGALHDVLRWHGWDGRGNLQASARDARYGLMRDFCQREDIPAILLGHTRDDQAETVLMRLARGSGVDGLSAMSEGRFGRDVVLRPLLNESRSDLRVWLTRQGMRWSEDPSNEDPRFDRVRARRLLTQLIPFGIDAERLAETAAAMARAREALLARESDVAHHVVAEQSGILMFEREGLAEVEEETRLRLVAHGLACLSGDPYKPRLASLSSMLDRAMAGKGGTLQGCRLVPTRDVLFLVREWKAVAGQEVAADGAGWWDNRWRIRAETDGAVIRALGEAGLAQIERPADLPHAVLLSHPGVWIGDNLLASPDLFNAHAIHCEYAASAEFHASIKSH